MVSDHALTHRTAYVKGHRRGLFAVRGFVLHDNSANLRTISVRKYNFISRLDQIRDIFRGMLNDFKLSVGSSGAPGFLKSVAAKSDYKLFHMSTPYSLNTIERYL